MDNLRTTYSFNDPNYMKAKVRRMKKKIKKEQKKVFKKLKRDTISYQKALQKDNELRDEYKNNKYKKFT